MSEIKFTIDGKECKGRQGQTIVEAAAENGIYIPVLCNYTGLKPAGSCRICTVKVGGRFMAACTTPITENVQVENETPEIEDMRKALVEMLFVEGNHLCPTCEKSGSCDLQALGYRYRMTVPRFPYLWPESKVNAESPYVYLDNNRCILCLRCHNSIKTPDEKNIFGLVERGDRTYMVVDSELGKSITEEQAEKAMEMCPVGAILRKEKGFKVPIGKRKYDVEPIGNSIEK